MEAEEEEEEGEELFYDFLFRYCVHSVLHYLCFMFIDAWVKLGELVLLSLFTTTWQNHAYIIAFRLKYGP